MPNFQPYSQQNRHKQRIGLCISIRFVLRYAQLFTAIANYAAAVLASDSTISDVQQFLKKSWKKLGGKTVCRVQKTKETLVMLKVSIVLLSQRCKKSHNSIMDENEVKNRITEAANGLFMRFGTRSVSMDDIARELSISKKTLYTHFSTKEEIVESAMMLMLRNHEEDIDRIHHESENAMDEFFKISEHFRSFMRSINPALLYDLQKFHPKSWQLFNTHKESCFYDSIVRSIEAGQKQGIFRKKLEVKILSKMRWEQIMLAFNPELFPPQEYDIVNVQMVFFEHFVHGICSQKGIELIEAYKKKSEKQSN